MQWAHSSPCIHSPNGVALFTSYWPSGTCRGPGSEGAPSKVCAVHRVVHCTVFSQRLPSDPMLVRSLNAEIVKMKTASVPPPATVKDEPEPARPAVFVPGPGGGDAPHLSLCCCEACFNPWAAGSVQSGAGGANSSVTFVPGPGGGFAPFRPTHPNVPVPVLPHSQCSQGRCRVLPPSLQLCSCLGREAAQFSGSTTLPTTSTHTQLSVTPTLRAGRRQCRRFEERRRDGQTTARSDRTTAQSAQTDPPEQACALFQEPCHGRGGGHGGVHECGEGADGPHHPEEQARGGQYRLSRGTIPYVLPCRALSA